MTKDEMKDRISMALKDPELRQGFEIICKENTELKGEAAKWHKVADGDLPNNYRYVWTNVGAERYKTKWHRLSAGDTPKENKLYLVKIKDNGLAIAYFNGQHWETRYNLGDYGHCVETVIAWCEIPEFEE